jgi:hypothetical protein
MKIKFPPGQRPFGANTGFKAPCEPSRWKVENLLTGFTGKIECWKVGIMG